MTDELDALVKRMAKLADDMELHATEDWDEHDDVLAIIAAITTLRGQLAAETARADRAEAERAAKPSLRLSVARKIGMYGSAYDGPFDARAYTYDHQPGNQAAWAIGRAASNATLDKVGDYIDRGLGLLRHLKAEGFGVFALNDNDNDTHDRTALDAAIRAAKVEAWKEAADFIEAAPIGTRQQDRDAILALIGEGV